MLGSILHFCLLWFSGKSPLNCYLFFVAPLPTSTKEGLFLSFFSPFFFFFFSGVLWGESSISQRRPRRQSQASKARVRKPWCSALVCPKGGGRHRLEPFWGNHPGLGPLKYQKPLYSSAARVVLNIICCEVTLFVGVMFKGLHSRELMLFVLSGKQQFGIQTLGFTVRIVFSDCARLVLFMFYGPHKLCLTYSRLRGLPSAWVCGQVTKLPASWVMAHLQASLRGVTSAVSGV